MRLKKLFSTVAVLVTTILASRLYIYLWLYQQLTQHVALEIGATYNVTTKGIFAKNSAADKLINR